MQHGGYPTATRRCPAGACEGREIEGQPTQLLLIRLFRQTTTGSIEAWDDRPFRRRSASFKWTLPPTRLARTTWPHADGLTGSLVPGAATGRRTRWPADGDGNALRADTRFP